MFCVLLHEMLAKKCEVWFTFYCTLPKLSCLNGSEEIDCFSKWKFRIVKVNECKCFLGDKSTTIAFRFIWCFHKNWDKFRKFSLFYICFLDLCFLYSFHNIILFYHHFKWRVSRLPVACLFVCPTGQLSYMEFADFSILL